MGDKMSRHMKPSASSRGSERAEKNPMREKVMNGNSVSCCVTGFFVPVDGAIVRVNRMSNFL
jgi:hypothetical protein